MVDHVSQYQEERIRELYASYHKVSPVIYSSEELRIILIERGMGRETYLAIKNGKPVAYVAGNRQFNGAGQIRFRIASSYVTLKHRRQGIGHAIYLAILNQGRVLISDFELSEGAYAMWNKLRGDADLKVRFTGVQYVAKMKTR